MYNDIMESFTKYVITDNNSKVNEHWDYCEKNAIPCITVTKVDEYYKVEMDMLSTPFQMTDDETKEVEIMIRNEVESDSELKEKSDFSVSNSAVDVYPIKKERIDEFCSKLFEIGIKQRKTV